MSIKKIVAITGGAIVVAGIAGVGGLYYAEQRAVAQFEAALKQLPSGLQASYGTAHYSLLSGLWTIEGLQVQKGPAQMRIKSLSVKDLDRDSLRALFVAGAPATKRALAREVTINGWVLKEEKQTLSISYLAIPFPDLHASLSETALFEPWKWVDTLQAPSVQALGIAWRSDEGEQSSHGYVDRLHLTKLARVKRTTGADGKFVWEPAQGTEGQAAVSSAQLTGLSSSWNKKDDLSENEEGDLLRYSLSMKMDELQAKEAILFSLLPLDAAAFSNGESAAVLTWLKGLEGQSVDIVNFFYSGDTSSRWGKAGEEAFDNSLDIEKWAVSASIGRFVTEAADGAGRLKKIRMEDGRIRHKNFYGYDDATSDISFQSVAGETLNFGQDASYVFEAGRLEAQSVSLAQNGRKTAGAQSVSMKNGVYQNGIALGMDLSLRGGSLSQISDQDLPLYLPISVEAITADADVSYAFDPETKILKLGRFDVTAQSLGAVSLSAEFAIGPVEDDFADPATADEMLTFLPSRWKEWLMGEVSLKSLEFRYEDGGFLKEQGPTRDADDFMPQLLSIIADKKEISSPEAQVSLSNISSFLRAPEEGALHLVVQPEMPVSLPALSSLVEYMPFDMVMDVLQMRLEVVARNSKAP